MWVLLLFLPAAWSCTMTCTEMQCPANSRTRFAGASSLDDCVCDNNFWRNGTCQACRPGFICDGNTSVPCPAGYWSNGTAVFDCEVGYTCEAGSIDGRGRTTLNSSIVCSEGRFLVNKTCALCPANATSVSYGCQCGHARWWDGGDCKACLPGWLCGANWSTPCPQGSVCNGTQIMACPANHTCNGGLDAGCSVGFGGADCVECPVGTTKDWVGYEDCAAAQASSLGVVVGATLGGVAVVGGVGYLAGGATTLVNLLQSVVPIKFGGSYIPLSTIDIPIAHTKYV